jgi:outer membrane protein
MKQKSLIIFTLVIASLSLVSTIYQKIDADNIQYVNLSKVFNEFKLTKELNRKLTSTTQVRQTLLDSLELELKLSYEKIKGTQPTPEFMQQQRAYELKKQNFAEQNQLQADEYDKQIWTQLNTYITNYAKENNIDLLLGARGDGSLMYGSSRKEVTEEVIEYLNKHYLGE